MPSSNPTTGRRDRLLAIALASFAILFFQIAVTRVLSVLVWYHWAFLSVSLAMLGLGAPGVWFAIKAPGRRLLPWTLLLGGITVPLSVVAILAATVWYGDAYGDLSSSVVVLCMGFILVPMLLLGAAVCILLLQAPGAEVGRLYGSDLLGASVAAACVVPLLNYLPTPTAIALVGLLPIVAAWRVGAHKLLAGGAAALIIALTVCGEPLRIKRSKLYFETIDVIERWTPTARLTFMNMGDMMRQLNPQAREAITFYWGQGTKAPGIEMPQYLMEQDGTAGTPITKFDGDTSDMSEFDVLMYDVTAVGYEVRPPQRAAIIGGGGGRDILTALRSGATDIDVAEFNGGVVETVSGELGEFSGDIYHAKGVHAHVSEGRSFLTRSRGEYDVIQISLIDSWAATAAGAYTLAENNLYTLEAFRLYFQKLSANGMLSASRWHGIEGDRLLLLAKAALTAEGVDDPSAHLMVVSAGKALTVLMSRSAFTDEDRARLQTACATRGFDAMYAGRKNANPRRIDELLAKDFDASNVQGVDLRPPVDDRPFFFQVLSVFGNQDVEVNDFLKTNTAGIKTLQDLMIIVTLFTLLLFFAPFVLMRWLPKGEGFWRGSTYFSAIGLAFMLIEIPWLQRFVLYLGHPSLAATVVIGSLLLGAGVGSLRSEKMSIERAQRLWWVLPLVLAATNLLMSVFFETTLGASEPVRVLLAIVCLMPIGYMLGHVFPLGMRRFGDTSKAWFWALNGACGVLAGVCSLALAMELGFQAVAWIGVGGYVLAGALLRGKPAA